MIEQNIQNRPTKVILTDEEVAKQRETWKLYEEMGYYYAQARFYEKQAKTAEAEFLSRSVPLEQD